MGAQEAGSANVDVVRRMLEMWNSGRMPAEEAMSDLAHPDLEMDLTSRVLNPARYSGLEGFRKFAGEVTELWSEFRMEPERFVEDGDTVVVLVHAIGRGRGSGVEVDARPGMVIGLREGKIATVQVVSDWEAALRAVGSAP